MPQFSQSTNQRRNDVNTTTSLVTMYHDEGASPSTLRLGFWNKYANFAVTPALPASQRQNSKMYDYDATASILLNLENLFAFRTGVNKYLDKEEANKAKAKAAVEPAKVDAKAKSAKSKPAADSVAIAPPAIIAVESTRANNEKTYIEFGGKGHYDGIDDYFIAVCERNDRGEIKNYQLYVFGKTPLLTNYDVNTPSTSKVVYTNSQFAAFREFLDYSCVNLIGGGAHGVNMSANEQNQKVLSELNVMKTLIEQVFANSSSSGGYSRGRSDAASTSAPRPRVSFSKSADSGTGNKETAEQASSAIDRTSTENDDIDL